MFLAFSQKVHAFFALIEQATTRRSFLPMFIVGLVLLSLFFATPKYAYFSQYKEPWKSIGGAYLFKSQNLSSSMSQFPPERHEAKLVFRLTIPLIDEGHGKDSFPTILYQIFYWYTMLDTDMEPYK
jgi:hypothetical protein